MIQNSNVADTTELRPPVFADEAVDEVRQGLSDMLDRTPQSSVHREVADSSVQDWKKYCDGRLDQFATRHRRAGN